MSDSMVIDGVPVVFEETSDGDGRFAVLASGRLIGSLELVRDSTELVAYRPDGEPLRAFSPFGGPIAARFGSREAAARALLKE